MKISRRWLCALAALSALPATAKVDDPIDLIQGRWYATEVIIFERADADEPGPEQLVEEGGRAWPGGLRPFVDQRPWRVASLDPLTRACLEFPRLQVAPPNELTPSQPIAAVFVTPPPIEPRLSPHPLLHLLRTAARQQEALHRDSYRWLPTQTHALKAEAQRLRNSPGLDLIWHGRWMQPVPDRSAGEPLMLVAQSVPGGGYLSGTLQVTLGRYLHFEAKLWLDQHREEPAKTRPYMQLHQARTLRSGELHYLDHPKMGVLVRMDPLPPSPALVEALQAWQASVEGA